MKKMKDMTIQWRNFLIIFFIIFLFGVVVGFLIIPHPQKQKEKTKIGSENSYGVIEGVVSEVRPSNKSVKEVVGVEPLEGVVSEVQPPIRAIGYIKPPKLIKRVDPIYPEKSRKAEVERVVILEVHTDIYGRVKRAQVLRSINPLVEKAAIDAIFQWKYEPKIINDRPREVIFKVPVRFKLK